MAYPAWFNKEQYLQSKLAQLVAAGDHRFADIVALDVAIKAAGYDAYTHFQAYSLVERTSPNAYFNAGEYLTAKAAQANAKGALEGGRTDWTADGIALAIKDAGFATIWDHFVQYGWKEGVNPSNAFDVSSYFASKLAELQATDAAGAWTQDKMIAAFAAAGLDPITHYLSYGKAEAGVVVTAVPAAEQVGGGSGQTFMLTTGVDAIVGTSGNDTINGIAGSGNTAAPTTTLQSLDNIDGGAGVDTLNLTNVDGTVSVVGATVKNVENLSILSGANGVTADVSKWTGLTSVSVDNRAATTANNSVTTDSNVTSVSVKGGGTVVVSDSGTATDATADTLTSVTLDNVLTATVNSDALTSLTLNNLNVAVGVTAAAATRALNVTLNNVGAGTGTAGTVTDGEATSVTLNTTGAASKGVDLYFNKATALTVNADEAVTIVDLEANLAKTITVKGDSLVTIATVSSVGALESVSSVDSTGGVTITPALGTAVSFTGGAGKDTITLGATTKAITTGAGDDNVTVGSSFGTGGSVDAGEGTDTLTMAVADAVAASSATSFETKIAGFEKLSITGTATGSVNLANLDDINYVKIDGTNGGLTLTGLTSGATLEQAAADTAAVTTVAINAADTNTADVLNLLLTEGATGTATVGFGSITANNVETIKITTDDTATTATGNQLVGTLVDAAATSISVSGDAGLALTFTGTKLTSFDASGVTKGAVTFTTGALEAAATIKGGAEANTFDITAATKAVSVTGGAKVDTIAIGGTAATVVNNNDNTVVTLDGNDVVTINGGGKNTVDLGAGDDTITFGVTATGDALTDLNVVTLGAGADTAVFNTAAKNGNTYTTITDFQVGDKLDFSNVAAGTAETFNKTAITLGGTAAFADFLAAASAGDGSTNANISWFQFSGDTYVVVDNSALLAYNNGVDTIVKLTGLVDLSNDTFAAGVITAV